jgi:murein peptide amidase A
MSGTYQELVWRWKALRERGIRVREVACVGAARTLLCAEYGEAGLPAVALAAGVHGDEPAGPWALLEFVESGRLDERFAYRLWPCTNPTGYAAGTRASADGIDVNRTFGGAASSPEAKAIVTANRDRRFALSIDLHEDCDATGFYCYEYGGGDLGSNALRALDDAGLPVDPLEATFDLAGPLEEDACVRERGRILADAKREAAAVGGYSYSMRLARRAARYALTFESPSSAPWDRRVATHIIAMEAVISALRTTWGHA